MSSHAILSASSSHRWLNCTPSARLELEYEDKISEAAIEGTAAHELCEHKLKVALGIDSNRPISDYQNVDMEEFTDDYVSYVLEIYEKAKEKCKDPIILIEQRLDFSKYVQDGFGTGDCLIVADDTLYVIDFKYGMGVLVDAYENPQMKLYGLGALEIYDGVYDIKNVAMTIFQPRRANVSTFEMSASSLKQWAETELKAKARLAFDGEGVCIPGEWCRFCKASIRCTARAEENLKLAEYEFKKPSLLSDLEIEQILAQLPELTKWANEVMSYATDEAVNHGKKWSGFKVVEGRSNRKYKDEEKVAEVAINNGYKDIYQKKLITLTSMQKLMGKSKFDDLLKDLIFKPKGKLTLVPNTDKRKAINVGNVNNEFNVEKGEF